MNRLTAGFWMEARTGRSSYKLTNLGSRFTLHISLITFHASRFTNRSIRVVDFSRRPVSALQRSLHPAGPCGSVLAREVDPALRLCDVRDQHGHLSRLKPRIIAARPFIFIPAFSRTAPKIRAAAAV